MADMTYIAENNLTVEVAKQKKSKQKIFLMIGVVLALLSLFVSPVISFLILVITAVAWLFAGGSEVLRAGAKGEDLSIETLSHLPNSYTVFNQVDLPNSKSRTGFNEADIIVVGEQAVFVVEVKHNKGTISGAVDDREWNVLKVGRGGTAYEKTMRNPIAQVKKLVWLLSEQFKKDKNSPWIQGIVVFSNEECETEIEEYSNVPVMKLNQLENFILNYKSRRSPPNRKATIENIAALKRKDIQHNSPSQLKTQA